MATRTSHDLQTEAHSAGYGERFAHVVMRRPYALAFGLMLLLVVVMCLTLRITSSAHQLLIVVLGSVCASSAIMIVTFLTSMLYLDDLDDAWYRTTGRPRSWRAIAARKMRERDRGE